MAQTIKFKRGLEADRLSTIPIQGEPLWTTDGKKLYVGDGSTAGGIDFLSAIAANYIHINEKGQANGVATLDASAKIPKSQLPAIAITDTFVVASEAAMLALTAQTGDVAIRTDTNKSFILKGVNASMISDWTELLAPLDTVSSVNGETGVVVLDTDNIGEGSTNLYFTDTRADTRANSVVTSRINDSTPSATNVYSSEKVDLLLQGALEYKGSWNASTNIPNLTDASGATNEWYKVSVGGTRDLGSGSIVFASGDDVIHNGTIWEKFGAVVSLDSDDITEGSTNLYYTQARTDARIAAATLDDLNDVDVSAATNGQLLSWNGSDWVPADQAPGVTSFVGLDDTPASFSGEADKLVSVNSAGDALVFTDIIDGGTF